MISNMFSSCLHRRFKRTSFENQKKPVLDSESPSSLPSIAEPASQVCTRPSCPSPGTFGGILTFPPPCSSDAY